MKERARELQAESQRGTTIVEGRRSDVPAKSPVPEPDRQRAVRSTSRQGQRACLSPKTWWGMTAYALGGKVVCFFQSAKRFDSRYATLGFRDAADLDEGRMWPASFALKELTPAAEDVIAALIKKAPG